MAPTMLFVMAKPSPIPINGFVLRTSPTSCLEPKMSALTLGFAVSILVACNAAFAAAKDPILPEGMMMLAQDEQAMTDGEVRKIDKDAKKITLKHGEIKNLAMPAMTMVFQVGDPAMLESVKSGDKVRFRAEKLNGALVVTRIEAARP